MALLYALSLASLTTASPVTRAITGPCDIYGAGGTACVAAHSTTRALYGTYDGALYQVTRSSDGATQDIGPLSAGGVANSGSQDDFCASTSCVISTIYDQSGNNNHLTAAPPGGAASGPAANGYDNVADATAAPITLGGQKVYGVYTSSGIGYRIDDTTGVAKGNDPEGMYMVFDGTHYNGNCCWDYGNAESDNHDDGDATMEAISFGTNKWSTYGSGDGPWVQADLENGLWAGGQASGVNPSNPTITYRFGTGMVKGDSSNLWAMKGANAQSGGLSTFWNGERPSGYYPMKKQGSIILGIGGDNSDGSEGTFYEGVMTAGYPSDDTENSVQANIVAASYST